MTYQDNVRMIKKYIKQHGANVYTDDDLERSFICTINILKIHKLDYRKYIDVVHKLLEKYKREDICYIFTYDRFYDEEVYSFEDNKVHKSEVIITIEDVYNLAVGPEDRLHYILTIYTNLADSLNLDLTKRHWTIDKFLMCCVNRLKKFPIRVLENIDIQIQPNKILFLVYLLNKYNDFNIGKIDESNYDSEVLKYVLNKEGDEKVIKKALGYFNKCNNIDFSRFYELCINNKDNAEFIEYMCILADQLARYGKFIYSNFTYNLKHEKVYINLYTFFDTFKEFIDEHIFSIDDITCRKYSLQFLISLFSEDINKKNIDLFKKYFLDNADIDYPYVLNSTDILTESTKFNFIYECLFIKNVFRIIGGKKNNIKNEKFVSNILVDRETVETMESVLYNFYYILRDIDDVKWENNILDKFTCKKYSLSNLKKIDMLFFDLCNIISLYIFDLVNWGNKKKIDELSNFVIFLLENVSTFKKCSIHNFTKTMLNEVNKRNDIKFSWEFVETYLKTGKSVNSLIKAI